MSLAATSRDGSSIGHGVWLYACGLREHVKLQCRCIEGHGTPNVTDTPCPTCTSAPSLLKCQIEGCRQPGAHTHPWKDILDTVDLELDIKDRIDQALGMFYRGSAPKRVHRDAVRTFKGCAGAGIRYALKQNSAKAFEEKWGEALLWYESVGELAAMGRAVVGSATVTESWDAAVALKGPGGQTDFCRRCPDGAE